MLKNGRFFGWKELDRLFTELEKNEHDIGMEHKKLGRHLFLKKKSQERQNVRKAQYIY